MKRLITICLAVAVIASLSSIARADDSWQNVTWQKVALDTLINGAVSYDPDGGNVVVSGNAFYDTIRGGGSYLGTQLVGGDDINEEVAGNLGIYGLFTYTDSLNILGTAMANPTQLLAFEIVANDLLIDIVGFTLNSPEDWDIKDRYALDARGVDGLDFMKASFSEIAQWGYTELAPGVWFDLAVTGAVPEGQVAMSIVIDGFQSNNFDNLCTALEVSMLNANLLEGPLALGTPGYVRDSGIFVAVVPEPATLAMLGLGGLMLRRKR